MEQRSGQPAGGLSLSFSLSPSFSLCLSLSSSRFFSLYLSFFLLSRHSILLYFFLSRLFSFSRAPHNRVDNQIPANENRFTTARWYPSESGDKRWCSRTHGMHSGGSDGGGTAAVTPLSFHIRRSRRRYRIPQRNNDRTMSNRSWRRTSRSAIADRALSVRGAGYGRDDEAPPRASERASE